MATRKTIKVKGNNKVIPATTEALAAHIEKKRGYMGKREFADKLGATRMMVHKWEAGDNIPGANYLEKLGLDLCYRVLDDSPLPADTPVEPVSRATRGLGAAAAKKHAKRVAKKKG